MTQNHPPNPTETSKTVFLKDSLRLAELQLEQIGNSLITIERKAILLVTLNVAVMAAMSAFAMDEHGRYISLASVTILAIATFIATLAAYNSKLGIAGADPGFTSSKFFDFDNDKMSAHLLQRYYATIKFNDKVRKKKAELLVIAFWIGEVGIILAFLRIFYLA